MVPLAMRNLNNLSCNELIEYLTGKKIKIRSSISSSEEEVIVRKVVDFFYSKDSTELTMKFLSPSGFRWTHLNKITSVGRKKYT